MKSPSDCQSNSWSPFGTMPASNAIRLRDPGGGRVSRVMGRWVRVAWIAVAGAALPTALQAQQESLTLEQALNLARQHSSALAGAAAAERGAEAAAVAARSRRLPTFDVDVLHLRVLDPPSLALGPAGIFAPVPASGTVMHLGVVQPLYTGGRVSGTVRAADWAGRAAAARYEGVDVDLTAGVALTHARALLAQEMLAVAEEAVRVHRAALTVAEDRFAAGSVPRVDVLRAETRLADGERDVRAAAEGVIAARETLAVRIGLDPLSPPPVAGRLEPADVALDSAAILELLVRARQHRPELRALAASSEAAREQAGAIRARRKPTAGLYVGGLVAHPEIVTGEDGWSTDLAVGLVVGWSVVDFGRTAAEAQIALAEAESLEAQARGSAAAAAAAVRAQVRHLERAELDMAAGFQNVTRAERTLVIAQDRYADGAGIQLEVFEAEVDLSRTRGALLQAIHDHRAAAIELRRAAGLPADAPLPAGGPR